MVRKLKELMKPDDENAMLEAVCGSAHQIWQAGLGAFARAQQEGGDLFDKLAQEGVELQRLTQRLTGEKGFSVTDTVARLAENASRQASGSWDKLEKIFEDRVARSLRTLGVPSRADIDALNRSIAELKRAIGTAEKKPPVKRAATAKPAAKASAKAPAKPALKRPTARSSAAKKPARSAPRAP
jgi:poly(hydroxyalkanoate) granule-associated protein